MNNSRMPGRWALLAIALVMVGTLAIVALPKAEAQLQPPSGGVDEFTIGSRQEIRVLEYKLENLGPMAVKSVLFEIDWLDDSGQKRMDFSAGHSGSFGWTVEVDNTKGPLVPNRMWFNATSSADWMRSTDPYPRAFYVGIIPVGSPSRDANGNECLTLSYTPTWDNDSTGPTRFVGDSGFGLPQFCIDRKAPEILPGGALTLDRDSDGYLDAMLVSFDERMDENTFDINQFEVRGYEIVSAAWRRPSGTNPDLVQWVEYPFGLYLNAYPWYGNCPAETPGSSRINHVRGCSQLLFELKEKSKYDTGARPELRISSGPLTDLAGNDVDRDNPRTVDGAPPLLMGAIPHNTDENRGDYERISLVFSENVQYSDKTPANNGGFYDPEGGCIAGAPKAWPDCGGPAYHKPTAEMTPVQPFLEYLDAAGSGNTCPLALAGCVVGVEHPPSYIEDDERFDLMDLILDSTKKLTKADVGRDFGDRIQCAPPKDHLRGWGNGGDYYLGGSVEGRTTDSPALTPDREERGHGMACPTRPVAIRLVEIDHVETNIWWDYALVHFSEPVAGISHEDPVTLGALDVITTNGGGPRGIVKIEHSPCEVVAKVHFAPGERVLPTDVDKTPSKIRAVADRIRSCATGLATYLDLPETVKESDADFRDLEQPRVIRAATLDQNADGVVDAYEIQWSEPIHDDSFCSGDLSCGGGASGSPITLADPQKFRQDDWSLYGPYHFDTDAVVDDDRIILKWAQGIDYGGGLFESQGPLNIKAINSGLVPHLQIASALVTDLVLGHTANDNIDQTGLADIREIDTAPPVVWIAETVDSNLDPAFSEEGCTIGGALRCDPDPNGLLDGYRLTFSEGVNDYFEFDHKDWHVEGYEVLKFDEEKQLENREGDVFFDEVFYLRFKERSETGGDTGETPELSYKATFERDADATGGPDDPKQPGPFRDLAGNLLRDFGAIAVDEIDDARPAIFRIEAFPGSNNLTVHFSEPVDDGAGEAVVRADLTYQNNNGLQGGASGFGISDRDEPGEVDPMEVIHQPGERKAVVPLNGNLTAGDISSDTLLVKAKSIRETAPGVEDKKYIVNKPKRLNFAPDASPPCAVRDLNVDIEGANYLRLTWIAPADDCSVNGNDIGGAVAGYVMRVNETAFTDFNATGNLFPNADVTFEFEPADFVTSGQTQSVTILGLEPLRQYNVAVRAFDDAGNYGPPGPGTDTLVATGTTANDPTPPQGTLKITSTTHPEGRPTLKTVGEFAWTGLTEDVADARIEYRYRLNRDPDYQVARSDPSAGTATTLSALDIPDDGSWWLHVRGYSGGGPAPSTAHYNVLVGSVPLDVEDIADCDDEINQNLKVVHKGGVNRLAWTLPECVENLGVNAPLVSLHIWRIDPGVDFFRVVEERDGSYAQLREGNYTDPTGSQTKDSRYLLLAEYAQGLDSGALGQSQGDPTLEDRTKAVKPVNQDPGTVPAWIWILLGVALALLIAGLVIFFILRHKDREDDASTAAGYQWEEIGGAPSGIDQASGLPIHDIQCPSCSTRFQAVGRTPLEVTCPNCRISGTLD